MNAELNALFVSLQNDLFVLGADLATPADPTPRSIRRIEQADVDRIEATIDLFETRLPPLTTFILPGGSSLAAQVHLARTICRRAERRMVALAKVEHISVECLKYINRLSDLLFVLGRFANLQSGTQDIPWEQ